MIGPHFSRAAHCVFAEPIHSPCMRLDVYTECTKRPASRMLGIHLLTDEALLRLLVLVDQEERIGVTPVRLSNAAHLAWARAGAWCRRGNLRLMSRGDLT